MECLVRSGIGFGGAAVAIDGIRGILHAGDGSDLTGSISGRPCTGDLLTPCSTCEPARAGPPIIALSLSLSLSLSLAPGCSQTLTDYPDI